MLDVGSSRLVVIGIPFVQQLHRFMIAVSRVAVDHDGKGGSAPDPLVWGPGSTKESA